jgi:hypothetical protein
LNVNQRSPHKLDQKGVTHHIVAWGLVFVLCFGIVLTFHSVTSHAAGISLDVKSGIAGYCLDDHDGSALNNAPVDSWGCNKSDAQNWTVNEGTITHGHDLCLAVADNGTTVGDNIVLHTCDQAAGQIWLRDKSGFENPNSGLCLSIPNSQTEKQLVVASCSYLAQPYETWISDANPACVDGTKGTEVACLAEQDWTQWQSSSPSHEMLLNRYTDGAPYEEWCADFVSYVYKQAGAPFSGGETNGWDENIASNIQNMGFTVHPASSHYLPQPGDVAYFDYAGGHVEIVISGGATPTFVYGNSASIDPTTGNGQMEANTITSKGSEGQVVYYLSPN